MSCRARWQHDDSRWRPKSEFERKASDTVFLRVAPLPIYVRTGKGWECRVGTSGVWDHELKSRDPPPRSLPPSQPDFA